LSLYFRLIWLFITANKRPLVPALGPSRITLTVLPNDLDALGHMNNGRFLSVMDLGRVDLLIRSGFYVVARKRRWFPLVGRVSIEYRKPLLPWQRYTIETRTVGWDDRWFYIQQVFLLQNEVAAVAGVKAMIRSPQGAVSPADALMAVGAPTTSPEIPACWAHLCERLSVSN